MAHVEIGAQVDGDHQRRRLPSLSHPSAALSIAGGHMGGGSGGRISAEYARHAWLRRWCRCGTPVVSGGSSWRRRRREPSLRWLQLVWRHRIRRRGSRHREGGAQGRRDIFVCCEELRGGSRRRLPGRWVCVRVFEGRGRRRERREEKPRPTRVRQGWRLYDAARLRPVDDGAGAFTADQSTREVKVVFGGGVHPDCIRRRGGGYWGKRARTRRHRCSGFV